MPKLTDIEEKILHGMTDRRPDLSGCIDRIVELHHDLVKMYDAGGKLLLCGNGGSNADAMHIAGELCKSFERKRTLPQTLVDKLKPLPCGEDLANHLEAGLAAIALGFNGSLKTAVENDIKLRDMAFAQEAAALAKPEDVIIGISTSGNATNCLMAMSVVKAIGGTVVSLTGPNGGKMAAFADIAIKAPGDSVKVIQEAHLVIYHTICATIEAHYFPDPR
ncbi:MAG: SIS domain-containing protein [Candidatus Hydrogenedentes bacterium]|nr:SIS domain-containing protein [Candidatus Hydrogenedentota bacterium]